MLCRYFRGYLKDVGVGQSKFPILISVHCDVQIFEWLLQFAQANTASKGGAAADNAGGSAQVPAISVDSVMPILISSNFLGVSSL